MIEIISMQVDLTDLRTRKNHKYICKAKVNSDTIEFRIETNQPVFIDRERICFADSDSTGNGEFKISKIETPNGFGRYQEAIAQYFQEAYRKHRAE